MYAYKGMSRPQLTYGCLVWGQIARHDYVQKKLYSFQRLALKAMGPMRKGTPQRGLEVLTYTRPLELEIRKLAAEAAIRTKRYDPMPNQLYSNIDCRKGHRQWSEEFLHNIGFKYYDLELDEGDTKYNWNRNFQIDLQSMEKGKFYGLPRLDAKIQIWTDGSLRSGGQAGAGLYICGGLVRKGFRLGEGVSIWQAELYAIYQGCLWIIDNPEEVREEKVVFNVDSQSAIKALMQYTYESKTLDKTLTSLREAALVCNPNKTGGAYG